MNWLKSNPNQLQFYYIRFSELGADRGKSTLVKKGKKGGLFGSVKKATQQIEEMRMLAERAMYLATRLPLLTGQFSEFWMSELLTSPDVENVLADLHTFSEVSQRMATVADWNSFCRKSQEPSPRWGMKEKKLSIAPFTRRFFLF